MNTDINQRYLTFWADVASVVRDQMHHLACAATYQPEDNWHKVVAFFMKIEKIINCEPLDLLANQHSQCDPNLVKKEVKVNIF